MNKTEIATVKNAVRTGFTFSGDSIFRTFAQAKRALSSLVRQGYLTAHTDTEGRTEYKPTDAARDFVTYGITAA